MHVVYLPKFCITIVSSFSWILHSFQEKIEDNGLAKFWGINRVHCGLCENSEFSFSASVRGNLYGKSCGHHLWLNKPVGFWI